MNHSERNVPSRLPESVDSKPIFSRSSILVIYIREQRLVADKDGTSQARVKPVCTVFIQESFGPSTDTNLENRIVAETEEIVEKSRHGGEVFFLPVSKTPHTGLIIQVHVPFRENPMRRLLPVSGEILVVNTDFGVLRLYQ